MTLAQRALFMAAPIFIRTRLIYAFHLSRLFQALILSRILPVSLTRPL